MTLTTPTTVDALLDYWPGDIPFKGSLASDDGCMSAQGQALHFLGGFTADQLRTLNQKDADRRVAELFGISTAHSALLRIVNDGQDGAPSCVIRNPEQVLGDQAQTVLAFWRHLDRMDSAAWAAARAAREATWKPAKAANWDAAKAAAWEAAWVAVWSAGGAAMAAAGATVMVARAAREATWVGAWEASEAAAGATNEIQGAVVMRSQGQPFYFLPLFGFADPEAVIAADVAAGAYPATAPSHHPHGHNRPCAATENR
jgi:hypothetical protein